MGFQDSPGCQELLRFKGTASGPRGRSATARLQHTISGRDSHPMRVPCICRVSVAIHRCNVWRTRPRRPEPGHRDRSASEELKFNGSRVCIQFLRVFLWEKVPPPRGDPGGFHATVRWSNPLRRRPVVRMAQPSIGGSDPTAIE